MRRAAESDVEGATDAAERVEESEGGLQFEEEEFSDDASPVSESAVDPGGAVHD
jgi:hypothetical protein